MEEKNFVSSNRKNSTSEKNSILERAPALIALATSLLYVLGFLVFNGYLASKGIYDQELLNTKYIMAGGLILIVITAYYYFIWRKIVFRIKNGILWHKPLGPFLRIFLDTYYALELVFGCAFLASWIAGLLMPDVYVLPVQLVTMLALAIDFTLMYFSLYQSYRLGSHIFSFVSFTCAIAVYFVWGSFNPPLISLLGIFVTYTFIGSVALASPIWNDKSDKNYGVFYLAIYLIVGVISFGTTTLEYISPRFGGTLPSKVTVTLARDTEDEIKQKFTAAGSDVFLIDETENVSLFYLGKDTDHKKYLQLNRKFISAITYEPPTINETEILHLQKLLTIK